jgi:ABC-2 type transport system ATP-binding protein
MDVIEVAGLRKSYRGRPALHGIDLRIAARSTVAVLGPNGAGKSTLVEILEGHRSRDGGLASVLGHDPARRNRRWRARIGIVLQETGIDSALACRELLTLYAGFHVRPRTVDEVLAMVGLGEAADTRANRLSGGQQRRLEFGLALIGRPELLFLDEPTTGFDPFARRQAWAAIEGLKASGVTIVLTTHYLDEAAALADRIVLLAGGRIVADGTPQELAARAGFNVAELTHPRPTLEDVYLELTG